MPAIYQRATLLKRVLTPLSRSSIPPLSVQMEDVEVIQQLDENERDRDNGGEQGKKVQRGIR
jgi:hypothetical protein